MKKIKVNVEKTRTGYSAYAEEFPVFSTGVNISSLTENIKEALHFYFDETGLKIKKSDFKLSLSFSISSFFELYPINTKAFSHRIGMNYTLLSQYIQGRKTPSTKQVARIVNGLKTIGEELTHVTIQ